MLCAISIQAAVTVTFRPSVCVDGPVVLLKDAAVITGSEAGVLEQIGEINIARNLIPGRERTYSTRHLESRCKRAFPNQRIRFRNTGRIKVLRNSRVIHVLEIKDAVKRYLSTNRPWKAEDTEVRFKKEPEIMVVSDDEYDLKVKPVEIMKFIGTERVRVQVLQHGEITESAIVCFETRVCTEVLCAARKISRNQTPAAADFVLKRKNITYMRHSPVVNAEVLQGKRAVRTITAGRVLDATMFAFPPLVETGDKVQVVLQRGEAVIKVDGVCRSDGYAGQQIPVYCVATKKILEGTVRDDRSVVIQ